MTKVAKLVPKSGTDGNIRTLPASTQDNDGLEARATVHKFVPKEVNMMPAQWAEPGNPTPYELRVTIHTCKRLWKLNKEALSHPDCDVEATQENIKTLERMYVFLMDYLVE